MNRSIFRYQPNSHATEPGTTFDSAPSRHSLNALFSASACVMAFATSVPSGDDETGQVFPWRSVGGDAHLGRTQ
ncbi:hypothetical protein [Sphingomonas yabuuchiae]|uniref:Uncharacterized protein n=1 Tax=Sphingomonas yabuuchiae TaxID=172044 RepID=A0AA41DBY8_9SPHN|nr:hypothetical protein [Sphingomonas yabuuchiae]MBB4611212.1 hypothetical protein [Sphingomonas yabuuchiae]MBN3557384.1 hypothetical protein [Sphingomonas yabuuchiae]